ncbi:MAG: hypothetical protein AVDCRST_MAG18-3638 [uncultured Thermomicrobiales bacterium]|jgi:uncharacterized protein YggT (Ycf19 family)|uniref:Cell division integral membrane protein, YggT and half-length relatives n=1 Tax=uncultured Thermomicrobiales bacterium TaxID=1645740 RepID=A0A6J4VW53_9BACT|nr:MAG: hypothetical protein AVDCRST_MAG18-3638 [uncultured Thermomicrobiales bacterium]
MTALAFSLMSWVIGIFPWVMMGGWIIGLADPGGNWAATRILNAITLPFIRLTSGMVPRIGQLDLSPMLVFLLAYVVSFLLRALY